jgi:hypothetical protein
MDLSLEIQGCSSLEKSLEQFTAAENLDGDNAWHCDRVRPRVVTVGWVGVGVGVVWVWVRTSMGTTRGTVTECVLALLLWGGWVLVWVWCGCG